MSKLKRKCKFVVWLNHRTDRRDDEWVVVWAKDKEEALSKITFDSIRFSLGKVMTAIEFKRENGFSA